MDTSEKFLFAINGDCCATAHFNGRVQVVAFYGIDFVQKVLLPIEVRTWRATEALAQPELNETLTRWTDYPASNHVIGISSEDIRAVSLGKMYRATDSKVFTEMHFPHDEFRVPSIKAIDEIVAGKLVPDVWRNSRDFKAHARELRSLKVYLHSVFEDQSIQPMRAVSEAENVSTMTARKIIDSARNHGYLTRRDGAMGGFVTEKARDAALLMNRAYEELKNEGKK